MPIRVGTHFAPWKLSRLELKELGRMVAWWGYLEFQMGVMIRRSCFKMEKEEQWLLLVGAEVRPLCAYLRTLAHSDFWITDPTLRADIAQFAADVEEASRERNNHVHGVYGYVDGPPEQRVRISFKPRAHRTYPVPLPISYFTLKALADEGEALWNRAQALTKRLKRRPKGGASKGRSP